MAKHTEGPWVIENGELIAVGPSGKGAAVLGEIYGADEYPCTEEDIDEECKANGFLVAAAPAYAMAWSLVPDEIKQRIFDALHKPDTGWVEAAIEAVEKGGG